MNNRYFQILVSVAILLLASSIMAGGVMGLTSNPFTWLACFVCTLISFLGVWYGIAIMVGVDWE